MKQPAESWNNYDINGLLSVRTNRKDYFPEYFLAKDETDNPNIILSVSGNTPKISPEFSQIGTDLFYSKDKEQVVSEITLLGYKGTLSIKRLTEKPTEVFINNKYRFLSQNPA